MDNVQKKNAVTGYERISSSQSEFHLYLLNIWFLLLLEYRVYCCYLCFFLSLPPRGYCDSILKLATTNPIQSISVPTDWLTITHNLTAVCKVLHIRCMNGRPIGYTFHISQHLSLWILGGGGCESDVPYVLVSWNTSVTTTSETSLCAVSEYILSIFTSIFCLGEINSA
jgi:hypothetical protein